MYPLATTMMLVHDDPHLADQVEQALNQAHGAVALCWGSFEFAWAPTIARALEMARSGCVQAAILSLDVPEYGGLVALDQLQSAAPALAIVAMTRVPQDLLFEAIQRGAQDFLLQNELDVKTLLRTLHACIQRKRADMVAAESRISVIWRLAKAAEFRDEETGSHVIRVGCYCRALAEALLLPREFIDTLFLTAPLHDIGKIGIPDAILLKRGRLTPDEWNLMQRHCEIGASILRDDSKSSLMYRTFRRNDRQDLQSVLGENQALKMACNIALAHHEKWNGGGYPHGLAGERIPLEARIVAVADVWDALLSHRPYKPAFDEARALEIMAQSAGTHFDPQVYRAFLEMLPELRRIRAEFGDPLPGPAPCEARNHELT